MMMTKMMMMMKKIMKIVLPDENWGVTPSLFPLNLQNENIRKVQKISGFKKNAIHHKMNQISDFHKYPQLIK